MQRLPLNTTIMGILAKEGKPMKLADIYHKIKERKISKTTVYRHLQSLVSDGLVSSTAATYVLAQAGDFGIQAADLFRINELKPVISEFQKGFKFTIYSSLDRPANVEESGLKSGIKNVMNEYLSSIDSELKRVLDNRSLTQEALKVLIGLKVVLVASFDGTDFSTFTSKEIGVLPQKRKEILNVLSKSGGSTLSELAEISNLNIVQIRQVVDPIISSGFAEMDESGKIRLTVELK